MKKLGLLIFSAITLFTYTAKAQFEGYTWKVVPTTNNFVPREEADLVEVNGLFYLIGGRKIQDISIFNPKTNTWSAGAKPPMELHHFQAVVFKDEIYLVGAMTAGYPHEIPVDNIYIYTPKTDTWRKGAAIPADRKRGSSGVAIYKNKFYVASGILDGHYTGNVTWFDEYDPKTDKWTKLPDAPTSRDHAKSVVVGDKLYSIGGIQSDAMNKKGLANVVAQIDIYDFKTGKWAVADAKLAKPRAGNAAVVIGNEILAIAGEGPTQRIAHNEVDAFNVKTGTIRSLPPLVAGRHAQGAIYFDKKIYICAGVGNSGGTPLLNTLEVFSKE